MLRQPPNSSSRSTSLWLAGPTSPRGAPRSPRTTSAERVLLEVSRAIRALPPLPPDPHPLDLMIEAFAVLITEGHAAAMPILQRAAKDVMHLAVEDIVRWGWHVGGVRTAIWHDEAIGVYERQAQLVREAGALAELPIHLQALALERAWRGDLPGARAARGRSRQHLHINGQRGPALRPLRIHALRGQEAEATPLIDAVIRDGTRQGQGIAVMTAHWAAAVLNNGLGRYEQAAAAAEGIVTKRHPALAVHVGAQRADRGGHPGRKRRTRTRRAGRTRRDHAARPIAAWRAASRRGVERSSRARMPKPSYRERLISSVAARTAPNWPAGICCSASGCAARADSARHASSCGRPRRCSPRSGWRRSPSAPGQSWSPRARSRAHAPPDARDELTPQEEQIARLARDGLTNAQIGHSCSSVRAPSSGI